MLSVCLLSLLCPRVVQNYGYVNMDNFSGLPSLVYAYHTFQSVGDMFHTSAACRKIHCETTVILSRNVICSVLSVLHFKH